MRITLQARRQIVATLLRIKGRSRGVYQSKEIGRSGRISKAGGHMLRHLLYEAAPRR